jgi:hypothetical protein
MGVIRTEFPEHHPILLFLADSGCRIGEAFALRWVDVDLAQGVACIEASIDLRGHCDLTKTGRPRVVELSTRLQQTPTDLCPDVFGDGTLVFPSRSGAPIHYQYFRSRVFHRIVRRAFGSGRRVTAHMLRHTFASLHLARSTNIKWVQETGGWTSTKMRLDVYGHSVPTESAGFADAITAPNGTCPATAPTRGPARDTKHPRSKKKTGADDPIRTNDLPRATPATSASLVEPLRISRGSFRWMEPTSGLEPLTCWRLRRLRVEALGRGVL